MRRWGLVISVFYALILLALIVPGFFVLSGLPIESGGFFQFLGDVYSNWIVWIPVGILLPGEALLLFLSVDTSQKRLKPRANILVSCVVAGVLTALLTVALAFSVAITVADEKSRHSAFDAIPIFLAVFTALWLFWGIVFHLYLRNSSVVITRTVSWLLTGSVLELLIVVPCHVIVRRRHDCSAPVVTSFGIATGVAIMLLSFGPSVLLLYKKRLDAYPTRSSG